jgi:3-hydroxyisobutyrate dehydrogenase
MTTYCPLPGVGPQTPADNDYQGGFATALMLKDLKLAVQAAQDVGATVPMGSAAEALYQMFANNGSAGLDFSAIIKMLDNAPAAA